MAFREISHWADAEDAVQDAMVKAMASAERFRGRRRCGRGCTGSCSAPLMRPGAPGTHQQQTAQNDTDPETSAAIERQRDALIAEIAALLDELPAIDRRAIELRDLEGYSDPRGRRPLRDTAGHP